MRRKSPMIFGLLAVMLLLSPQKSPGDEGKHNYIRMEETRIMGVIEHPEVTYIIPKTVIRFSHIPLERSFKGPATRRVDPQRIQEEIRFRTIFSSTKTHQEE